MFHEGGALSPSLLRIAFTAVAVVKSQESSHRRTGNHHLQSRALSSEKIQYKHTFNRISLGRRLSLRSRPPRSLKHHQQQEQQHRGDRAMEETAATQPGLPHLSLPGALPAPRALPAHSAAPFEFL
jgi:hypothetical protein